MTEKIAGTIAVLAVVLVGGYFTYKGLTTTDELVRTPVEVVGIPEIVWAFDPAGTDETDTPLTAVSLIWEGKTFDAGTHPGSCVAIEGSSWALVPGEKSGAICWWAGGGVELGVFEEGGELIVKRGYLDEGSAEEEGMRGGFEPFFVLKKTGDSVLLKTRIDEHASGLGVRVTPVELLEDSRCPEDVACIQAGTVRVRASVTSGARTTEGVFTLGIVETREQETITLVAVEPAPRAGVVTPLGEYRFTFGIEKRAE
ncbi:hypothetical protein K2Y00_01685 [Patescibacteria group bacterium]|nr:hypothetical protein [Patescibacteria group bacterium]